MKLRFLAGRSQGRIVDIKPTGLTLGRDQTCSLCIEEEGISREHCRIYQHAGKWFIEDLKSTNGVRLNGQRLIAPAELRPGDRIGVSQQLFLFADDNDIVDVTAEIQPSAAPAPAGTQPPAPVQAPAVVPVAATMPEAAAPAAPAAGNPNLRLFPWGRLLLVVGLLIFLTVMLIRNVKPAAGGTDPAVTEQPAAATGSAAASSGQATPVTDGQFAPSTGDVSPEILAAMDELMGDNQGGVELPRQPSTPQPVPARQPAAPVSVAPTPATASGAAPAGQASSAILINTTPAGAKILINNQERGLSPLVIDDLPAGRHNVIMRKEGYEDLVRQIFVPSLIPKEPYSLRQRAGTVLVTSTPAGATVMHGTQVLGQTPLLIGELGTGQHEVRLLAPGHEPQKKSITVSGINSSAVHVDLPSVLGGLQIVTEPNGCEVRIDGTLKGVTLPGEGGKSKPFIVRGLPEGEHLVEVEHPYGAVRRGKLRVQRGETRETTIVLWVVDTRLTLKDGSVKVGMLVEKNEHGDFVIAETPKRLERYLSPQIAKHERLTSAEAREFMGKSGDARSGGLEPGGTVAMPATTPEAAPGGRTVIAAQNLEREFERYPEADLNRMYQNKPMVISGAPISVEKDAFSGRFDLGKRIRCFMDIKQFEAAEGKIRGALDARQQLTVSGTVAGYHAGALILRNCKLE